MGGRSSRQFKPGAPAVLAFGTIRPRWFLDPNTLGQLLTRQSFGASLAPWIGRKIGGRGTAT